MERASLPGHPVLTRALTTALAGARYTSAIVSVAVLSLSIVPITLATLTMTPALAPLVLLVELRLALPAIIAFAVLAVVACRLGVRRRRIFALLGCLSALGIGIGSSEVASLVRGTAHAAAIYTLNAMMMFALLGAATGAIIPWGFVRSLVVGTDGFPAGEVLGLQNPAKWL